VGDGREDYQNTENNICGTFGIERVFRTPKITYAADATGT